MRPVLYYKVEFQRSLWIADMEAVEEQQKSRDGARPWYMAYGRKISSEMEYSSQLIDKV